MKKVQISLDETLMERIDSYADSNYMSRSGMITLACTQFLNQNEAILAIKQMGIAMKKISDTGVISDEQKQQMEDFERICSSMYGM